MPPAVRTWLAAQWAEQFRNAAETMLTRPPDCRIHAGSGPAPDAEWVWQECRFPTIPEAALRIGSSESWLRALGRAALDASGLPDASAEDALATAREILSQANAALAAAVGGKLGRDCPAGPLQPGRPQDRSGIRGEDELGLEVTAPGVPHGFLALLFGTELERALEAAEESKTGDPSGELPAPPGPPPSGASKTFDLLLEVELPVSVSFGRAQLPLRDVLILNSGSIVELNRTISEPVEIIVNNCVIARGEVVVVEGNYGVRIQQVISREERLRTLH